MTDTPIITTVEAFEMLAERERPRGLVYLVGVFGTSLYHEIDGSWSVVGSLDASTARDRVCQAVEEANAKRGWYPLLNDANSEGWSWWDRGDGLVGSPHPDRLTAACLAYKAREGA
jgi:hypothetical protein